MYPPLTPETLHSDCLPTEAESSQTAACIFDEEGLKARYDTEINRLRDIASKLEREKESLAEVIGQRKSWISALRRFPLEILDQIFLEVVRDNGHSLSISSEKISTATLPLSQVCSRWRHITQGLPHLWSKLGVDISDLKKNVRPLIQLHLQHAKDSALTVHLYDSDRECGLEPGDDPMEYLGAVGCTVYRTIMKELHRCEELYISLQPKLLSISVDPWFQLTLSFPRLRKFDECLSEEAPDWNSPRIECPRWFRDAVRKRAPMLVHARIDYLSSLSQTMFQCSELTSLEVTVAPRLDSFVEFLSHCTSLRTLIFEDLEFWESTINHGWQTDRALSPITPPVQITSLQRASFTTCDPYDLGVFLRSVVLPGLEDLTIDVTNHHSPAASLVYTKIQGQSQFQSLLLDLLDRSSCQLKRLKLAFDTDDTYKALAISWSQMFEACPQLTHFYFVNADTIPGTAPFDLLLAFVIRDNDPLLLPILTNFKIDGINSSMLEECILHMLEQRARSRACASDFAPLYGTFRFRKEGLYGSSSLHERMGFLRSRGIFCEFEHQK